MDLASVKASVKAWEKAFKSAHGRPPGKQDVKDAEGGIAEQYSLYRRLAKAQSDPRSAKSTGGPASVSSTSTPLARVAEPSTPTPQTRRLAPASRATASASASVGARSLKRQLSSAALAGPSSSQQARAQVPAEPSTPKRPRPGYAGPVHDPNPFNPFAAAPASTPGTGTSQRSPARASALASKTGPVVDKASPFIHASSPRKLKEALAANSLRKSQARRLGRAIDDDELDVGLGLGSSSGAASRTGASPAKTSPHTTTAVTPRTRARKRLLGEAVDDTPAKDRAPRRLRGQARDPVVDGEGGAGGGEGVVGGVGGARVGGPDSRPSGSHAGRSRTPRRTAMGKAAFAGTIWDGLDDDDDEFGPTPVKAGSGYTFLLGETGLSGRGRGRGGRAVDDDSGPSELDGSERGAKLEASARSERDARPSTAVQVDTASEPDGIDMDGLADASLDGDPDDVDDDDDDRDDADAPFLPPISVAHDDDADLPSPSGRARDTDADADADVGGRDVAISDDDDDEWDPEAGRVVRTVRIVRTRPERRGALPRRSSDDEGRGRGGGLDYDGHDKDEDEDEAENGDTDGPGANADAEPTSTRPNAIPEAPDTSALARPLLEILSLHSPVRRADHAARARAILAGPAHARVRGPDIYVSGEGNGADGDDDDELLGEPWAGAREVVDDDWESETEGWKAVEEDEDW
ncbi:hypothetical protein Q5752_005771 [Cryptotrichosporon argae]